MWSGRPERHRLIARRDIIDALPYGYCMYRAEATRIISSTLTQSHYYLNIN